MNKRVLRWLILIALLLILGLGYYGHLAPVKEILDAPDITFDIRGVPISPWGVLKILMVIAALYWVASLLTSTLASNIAKISSLSLSNQVLLTKLSQILIFTAFFFLSLDVLGVDLTVFAIFGGAVGIGVGFGIQKIASNFISGLILLFEKSVRVDDLIELDNGTFGLVKQTGGRFTLIRTFEGKDIMVPNEDFITSRVTNWTLEDQLGRVDIKVGVAYGSDLEKAKKCILDAARSHPRCVEKPEANCYLTEFGDSSINFYLLFWVDNITTGRWQPKSEVMMQIWRNFKKAGIAIPFPQRDVWIKEMKGKAGK